MTHNKVALVAAAAAALLVLAAGCSSHEAASPTPPAAPAEPHGGHGPVHGGVLMMVADIHFETVLDAGGHHRVYWSDGARRPLPATAIEAVALTIKRRGAPPERLPLAPDPTNAFWLAAGAPLADLDTDADVTFNRRGEPIVTMQLVRPEGAHGHAH